MIKQKNKIINLIGSGLTFLIYKGKRPISSPEREYLLEKKQKIKNK